MKILISGFEPFGTFMENPTQALAEAAAGWTIEGAEIHTVVLPVVYRECASRLRKEIEAVQPDVVLSLGIAAGRSAITPERIGINVQHTEGEGKYGDNAGHKPQNQPLVEGGPDGLFSTIPSDAIVKALHNEGIPAQISNTAGTYICNNTLYETLLYAKEEKLSLRAGFIHVPPLPSMTAGTPHMPSMSLEVQARALKIMIEVLAGSREQGYFH
ncbi:pyroglutamyl-peptidase I [Alteribacter natronophilus]|uniref:pyroglutamyl-peptidase I n=1 Tax=Alteribacter natronophilus TaxID=2583810 RepID=UPI00110DCA9C|nr:pyroglutamyl-peptidase I [Alteribacter natronophilus]TMW71526.1 pyroglutamyl-peptidase I [Alteribacter natronophilus]